MKVLLRIMSAINFLVDPDGYYIINDEKGTTSFLIVNQYVYKAVLNKHRMRHNGDLTLKRRFKAAFLILKGTMVSTLHSFGIGG